ncbi:hypothetical protein [Saccharopolyspora sp. 5N708]|uniref:hypothetical protein n=1 Tax=Saccharopolyspora sp. 5N708 TaxID=3457424 RepID=UPI003FD2657B
MSNAPVSRTWRSLTIWCAILLVLVLLAVLSSFWYFREVHGTAESIRDRDGVMIVDVSVARNALVMANGAAIGSFYSGQARLAGPGQDYYSQMSIVSQSLTQAAEFNSLDRRGSDALQTVESLLASYSDSINQAGAYFRANDDLLATVALWNAWRTLHDDGAILGKLQELRDEQHALLGAQVRDGLGTTWKTSLWLAVNGVALFGLIVVQVYFRRRFRRVFNAHLLIASAVLVALCATTGYAVAKASEDVVRTAGSLDLVLRPSFAEAPYDLREYSRNALAAMVNAHCGIQDGSCGETVGKPQYLPRVPQPELTSDDHGLAAVDKDERNAQQAIRGAAQRSDWWPIFPLAGGLGLLFVFLGFRPRLNEYWFRKL